MKHTIYALTMFALAACTSPQEEAIDRHALVTRNMAEDDPSMVTLKLMRGACFVRSA